MLQMMLAFNQNKITKCMKMKLNTQKTLDETAVFLIKSSCNLIEFMQFLAQFIGTLIKCLFSKILKKRKIFLY